jgi:hypothetical protein
LDGKEQKLSISTTSTQKLVYMQSQRHFVERAFQDAKSELGMAQYQARNLLAWHRHMALVMMGMLFFLTEKTFVRVHFPFITIADLVMYFSMAIPDKKASDEGLFEVLERRNEKRRQAHKRHYADQPSSRGLLTSQSRTRHHK